MEFLKEKAPHVAEAVEPQLREQMTDTELKELVVSETKKAMQASLAMLIAGQKGGKA
jgi:hypothetical protein